jgi:hypothetical protein
MLPTGNERQQIRPPRDLRDCSRADGKWKVFTKGGEQPRWQGDSKETLSLGLGRVLFAASIKPQRVRNRRSSRYTGTGHYDSSQQVVSGVDLDRHLAVSRKGKEYRYQSWGGLV